MSTTTAAAPRGRLGTADFDVHGRAGVRVLDGTPADIDVVRRQLGGLERPLERIPDVVVRFVDRIELGADRLAVGPESVADAQTFLVRRGAHKAPVRVDLPMDRIGGPCEVRCERGLSAVPLLLAVVNLTVLANGGLPLHASAVESAGRGLLVTGWAKGGKTETLLSFTEQGASYVGDEWVYIDDGALRGLPEPVRVWGWHVAQLPRLRAVLGARQRLRLAALDTLGSRLGPRGGTPGRLGRLLAGQASTRVAVPRLFGAAVTDRAPLDAVVLVTGGASEVVVRPIAAAEVAARMCHSLEEERAPLLSAYRRFRFAFPDRVNDLLERAGSIERERLDAALSGVPAYHLAHPDPAPIGALADALTAAVGELA